jgi:hypothetical protein
LKSAHGRLAASPAKVERGAPLAAHGKANRLADDKIASE